MNRRKQTEPMPSAARHRVLLVEDDDATRAHLARVIAENPLLELLGAAGSCGEARRALADAEPDVLLVDLDLPDGNGVDLIRELKAKESPTESMVITVFGDESHVVSAIEAGATGYLLKDSSSEGIGRAIVELVGGGSPISPAIARHLLKRFRPVEPAATPELPALTDREHEVLVLLVKGFTYSEIADLLGISAHTVTSHVKHIYRKLAVGSRGEAVYEALNLGLVKNT
ncbi:MAG: response regulator [Candidatus Binatia bacterium]